MREIPVQPSRMIHFFPPSNEKMVAKVPDIAPTVDVLLANLEDGVPATDKEAARAGLVEVGKTVDFGDTQFWTRVNCSTRRGASTTSPPPSPRSATQLDVIMIPKVEGPEDIHYVDRLLAQLEAKAGLTRPILRARHPRDRPRRRQRRGDLRAPAPACRASRSAPPTSPPTGA